MPELKELLKALPVVAGSPLAMVGYVAVIAAWISVALIKSKPTLSSSVLRDLPKNRRLEGLKELNKEAPRDGLSGHEWLESKRHKLIFFAFSLTLFVILAAIACVAWVASQYVNKGTGDLHHPEISKPADERPAPPIQNPKPQVVIVRQGKAGY